MQNATELEQLIQKTTDLESTYTSSLVNYLQIQIGRLDVSLQERQEIIGLFVQGITELKQAMFHGGVTVGYSLNALGLGDTAVNMVTQAFAGGGNNG